MVVGIGNVDGAAIRGNGDALRVRELPVAGNGKAQAAPFAQEVPDGIEVLDAVVAVIGNVDRSIQSDGDVGRNVELTIAGAQAAPCPQEGSLRVEALDAVVEPVSDVDRAVGGGGDTPRAVELAVARNFA